MFWESTSSKKKRLLGLKTITINGMKFVIKRVNPLMDFPSDKVPQLFTDSPGLKSIDLSKSFTPLQVENIRQTVLAYIQAGVVEPRLVPIGKGDIRGKEAGITSEDLFRDPSMGLKLYFEILDNSLNVFSGLKGLFFSIKRKLWLSISLRLGMGASQLKWWQATVSPPPSSVKSSISLS